VLVLDGLAEDVYVGLAVWVRVAKGEADDVFVIAMLRLRTGLEDTVLVIGAENEGTEELLLVLDGGVVLVDVRVLVAVFVGAADNVEIKDFMAVVV
jgi:hypothetical protein